MRYYVCLIHSEMMIQRTEITARIHTVGGRVGLESTLRLFQDWAKNLAHTPLLHFGFMGLCYWENNFNGERVHIHFAFWCMIET